MNEPKWAARNILLNQFKLNEYSIVDFGCGDKSFLNYFNPKEYIGLDKNENADIVINFNSDDILLNKEYDIGLVLGVLEYVEDPNLFLKKIMPYAKKFIIMSLHVKRPKFHHGWVTCFNTKTFNDLVSKHFLKINYYNRNRYIIAECIK